MHVTISFRGFSMKKKISWIFVPFILLDLLVSSCWWVSCELRTPLQSETGFKSSGKTMRHWTYYMYLGRYFTKGILELGGYVAALLPWHCSRALGPFFTCWQIVTIQPSNRPLQPGQRKPPHGEGGLQRAINWIGSAIFPQVTSFEVTHLLIELT